jgi:hypothetical protein
VASWVSNVRGAIKFAWTILATTVTLLRAAPIAVVSA